LTIHYHCHVKRLQPGLECVRWLAFLVLRSEWLMLRPARLGRWLGLCAVVSIGLAAPAFAQSLDRQHDPGTTGSLGSGASRQAIIRAANGIGGGFIEDLFSDQGLANTRATDVSRLETPLPDLPDSTAVYAPARPSRALPDQRYSQIDPQLTARPVFGDEPAAEFQRQIVAYGGGHGAGTVVIDTQRRYLFLVQGDGTAMRYGIGVGRPGFEWAGAKTITRKAEWPDWRPPAEMRKRRPDLPEFMEGGVNNPLGARAMYLGSSLYRIHGTNEPSTIGHAVSSGCIRMTNDDVQDLYERVRVGTRVVVM
jgi:lipoprotein-anchoring transpeptidase ErfK/SrfK